MKMKAMMKMKWAMKVAMMIVHYCCYWAIYYSCRNLSSFVDLILQIFKYRLLPELFIEDQIRLFYKSFEVFSLSCIALFKPAFIINTFYSVALYSFTHLLTSNKARTLISHMELYTRARIDTFTQILETFLNIIINQNTCHHINGLFLYSILVEYKCSIPIVEYHKKCLLSLSIGSSNSEQLIIYTFERQIDGKTSPDTLCKSNSHTRKA